MPDQIEHADAVVPYDNPTDEDREPMDDEELEAIIGRVINDAVSYSDSELSPARKQATDYYLARPFGDEEKGRSQIVSTEVRDTVRAILPSLMRVFFGPDRAVEFLPSNADTVAAAKQATDFIADVVIRQDNPGFLELYSAFKDALIRRRGVVKWWWDDVTTVEDHHLTNMTEDSLLVLEADPKVEYEIVAQYEHVDSKAMAAYAVMQQARDEQIANGATIKQLGPPPVVPQATTLFDVDVRVTNPDGRARFGAVPSEEFLHSPDARSIEDAKAVIHRSDKTRSELIALGVPEDIIDDIGLASTGVGSASSRTTALKSNEEAIGRMPGETMPPASDADEAAQDIPFWDIYIYLDRNGDDIAEHLKVTAIGQTPRVVWIERWPERPFAIFEFDPEPHTMVGSSAADYTMDLQLIKSKLERGVLDSLAFSLHPRTAIVEGEVSLEDVLNTEIGAVIRERQPGMVREFSHQFNGAVALPWVQYLDEQKENRTGISKAAAGLDPDSLQSTTRAAVAATISGAQQHLDLAARLMAETGMRQLMRGLLKLVVAHQPASRMVRLRGEFVSIDPRVWDANMDVAINVGIGMTRTEERIAQLQAHAAKQEQLLTQLGMDNPVVTLGQYVNTLHRLAELGGEKDTTQFYNVLPLDFKPPQQPPKPSPEEMLAQAQAEKVKLDAELAAATLQQKAKEIQLREDRERDRIEADMYLRAKEMEMKYSTSTAKLVADITAKLDAKRKDVSTND